MNSSRYILMRSGRGVSSVEALEVLNNTPGAFLVERAGEDNLLVEATSAALRALRSKLKGWQVTPQRTLRRGEPGGTHTSRTH